MGILAQHVPPFTQTLEFDVSFVGMGWMDIEVRTGFGSAKVEWASDICPTFKGLALSAIAIAAGSYVPCTIVAEHEPGETIVSAGLTYIHGRNVEKTPLVVVKITSPFDAVDLDFSVDPDVYIEAVRSLLVGLRDRMGIEAYYNTYHEEFPSKALAALEAAIRTPATPMPPPDMTGSRYGILLGSTKPDESKTDD